MDSMHHTHHASARSVFIVLLIMIVLAIGLNWLENFSIHKKAVQDYEEAKARASLQLMNNDDSSRIATDEQKKSASDQLLTSGGEYAPAPQQIIDNASGQLLE